MPQSIAVQIAGHSFELFAAKGLFWPDQRMLFVADTHLGKEATFRTNGIPIPIGSTDGTLTTISKMLCQTGATRLCILGDMFHARSSLSPDVRLSVESFLAETPNVEFTLVKGNHDASVGRLPLDWPIEVLKPGHMIGRVALGHHPAELPQEADVYLCGHIHPAIHVASASESLGKFPCFWHSRGCIVLPAIGGFTGTCIVRLDADDDAWIVADKAICKWASAGSLRGEN